MQIIHLNQKEKRKKEEARSSSVNVGCLSGFKKKKKIKSKGLKEYQNYVALIDFKLKN